MQGELISLCIFFKGSDFIPRIIAGKYKGIILKTPKGMNTRPTIDRTKEALFSIILPYIKDAIILDLFSGTGSLGLEALSRGAKYAYLNDYSRECNKIIKENISKCKIDDNYQVLQMNFINAIKHIKNMSNKIDIVFLDPPYKKGLITTSIENLHDSDIINKDGLIICEYDKNEEIEEKILSFVLVDKRKYGIANIAIYKKR